MRVYESDFLIIDLFEEDNILLSTWTPKTINMDEEDWKSNFLNYLEVVLKYGKERNITDERELHFSVSTDLQEWVNKNVFAYLSGLRVAVMLSENLIQQLAVEQLLDEPECVQNVQAKFFDSYEKSRAWILSLDNKTYAENPEMNSSLQR